MAFYLDDTLVDRADFLAGAQDDLFRTSTAKREWLTKVSSSLTPNEPLKKYINKAYENLTRQNTDKVILAYALWSTRDGPSLDGFVNGDGRAIAMRNGAMPFALIRDFFVGAFLPVVTQPRVLDEIERRKNCQCVFEEVDEEEVAAFDRLTIDVARRDQFDFSASQILKLAQFFASWFGVDRLADTHVAQSKLAAVDALCDFLFVVLPMRVSEIDRRSLNPLVANYAGFLRCVRALYAVAIRSAPGNRLITDFDTRVVTSLRAHYTKLNLSLGEWREPVYWREPLSSARLPLLQNAIFGDDPETRVANPFSLRVLVDVAQLFKYVDADEGCFFWLNCILRPLRLRHTDRRSNRPTSLKTKCDDSSSFILSAATLKKLCQKNPYINATARAAGSDVSAEGLRIDIPEDIYVFYDAVRRLGCCRDDVRSAFINSVVDGGRRLDSCLYVPTDGGRGGDGKTGKIETAHHVTQVVAAVGETDRRIDDWLCGKTDVCVPVAMLTDQTYNISDVFFCPLSADRHRLSAIVFLIGAHKELAFTRVPDADAISQLFFLFGPDATDCSATGFTLTREAVASTHDGADAIMYEMCHGGEVRAHVPFVLALVDAYCRLSADRTQFKITWDALRQFENPVDIFFYLIKLFLFEKNVHACRLRAAIKSVVFFVYGPAQSAALYVATERMTCKSATCLKKTDRETGRRIIFDAFKSACRTKESLYQKAHPWLSYVCHTADPGTVFTSDADYGLSVLSRLY